MCNASAASGANSSLADELRALASAAGLDAEFLLAEKGSDLPSLTSQAISRSPHAVVAVGGDGTMNCVASQLAGTDIAMGVIAGGTLNHFAKDLGIPLDPQDAIAVLRSGRTVQVDVAQVNDRIFINNSSLGLYPLLVLHREEKQQRGYGKWRAFVHAAFDVFRRYPFVTATLQVEGAAAVRRSPSIFIGNNQYSIDGADIGSRASVRGGKLWIAISRSHSRADLLKTAIKALLPRADSSDGLETLSAVEIIIDSHRKHLPVAFDGEVQHMTLPLHYRILPGALKVIVPAA